MFCAHTEKQQQPGYLDVNRHQKKRMDVWRRSSANLPGPRASGTRHRHGETSAGKSNVM
mgnify:CR=1 FL=1